MLIGKWEGVRYENDKGQDTLFGGEKINYHFKWEFDKTHFTQFQKDGSWTKIEFYIEKNQICYLKASHYTIEKLSESELIIVEVQKYPWKYYLKKVNSWGDPK